MPNDEKRVVLIKPGDVLLIGNVEIGTAEEADEIAGFMRKLGLSPVLFFGSDVQVGSLTPEQLRDVHAALTRELMETRVSLANAEQERDGLYEVIAEMRAGCQHEPTPS